MNLTCILKGHTWYVGDGKSDFCTRCGADNGIVTRCGGIHELSDEEFSELKSELESKESN